MKTLLLSALISSAIGLSLQAKAPETEKAPNCEVGVAPGKYSDHSIYRLDSDWMTDAGKTMKLESLRGKPMVLALFFTHCEHSCPAITKDMKAMQAALSRGTSAKVNFVLVSIDPDRDNTEALTGFRTQYKLTGDRWTLLSGKAGAVKDLSERVGFKYYPGSKTQFAHSLLITVLNADGEIVHQQVGIGADRKGAIATLEKLAAQKAKPAPGKR